MHVYRILMPAKDFDWKEALIGGLFYSTVNFGVLLPLLVFLHRNEFPIHHPYWHAFAMMLVILIAPVFWPLLWSKVIRNKNLMKHFHLPYPTAWDYFFDQRKPAFVLIHLKNGRKIGGYYGPNSYATSFPRDGDIFMEAAIRVNGIGNFEKIVENTMGVLIRKDEYELLEFFRAEMYHKSKWEDWHE